MGCKDYLDIDLEAVQDVCNGCFLFDSHDPTSCRMGKLYIFSNFGGGQDPWLYIEFFACLFFWLCYYKFNRSSGDRGKSEVLTMGQVACHTKKGSSRWVFLAGNGITVAFACQFIARIVFATAGRDISRNVNVLLSGFHTVGVFLVVFALTGAWWELQFMLQGSYEEVEPTKAPYPGLFRKIVYILGCLKDQQETKGQKIFRYFAMTCDTIFAIAAFLYILAGIILAATNVVNDDTNSTYNMYQVCAGIFNLGVLFFVADTAFTIAAHRNFGLKLYLRKEDDQEGRKFVVGANQRKLERSETALVLVAVLLLLTHATMLLRMSLGYCPFIAADEDLYHGGNDAAESAAMDLAIFLLFFLLSYYFMRVYYLKAFLYWKGPIYNSSREERKVLSKYGQANQEVLDAISGIISSLIMAVISICVVIIDYYYKIDAGMIGRVLYFLGYFFAISVFDDKKLVLIIMDNRFKFMILFRIISTVLTLYLLAIYIAGAVRIAKFVDSPNKDKRFDLWLFISGLVVWFVKFLTVFAFERALKKHLNKLKALDQEVEMQQQQQQQESSSTDPTSINDLALEDAEAPVSLAAQEEGQQQQEEKPADEQKTFEHVTTTMLAIADLSHLVSGAFQLWVLAAVVWNALGLVMVIIVFASMIALVMKNKFYDSQVHVKNPTVTVDNSDARISSTLGAKRRCVIFLVQLVLCIAFYFATQMFYFVGQPLLPYQKQVMIGGHRGVWEEGYAENSREAMDRAMFGGFHSVEVDMRMTKDQILVAMHDLTLDRTTNGTGYVSDYNADYILNNLVLKREGQDVYIDEKPMDMDQVIQEAISRDQIINIEVKADPNTSAIALALDAICRNNATEKSFISTGDPKFQHILSKIEPNVTLQKDFLLYTPTMSLMTPGNVNIYAISAELLLFNTWVIPNAHAAGIAVMVYFLAIETPNIINYFLAMGVDILLLNVPQNCIDAGQCIPPYPFNLTRII